MKFFIEIGKKTKKTMKKPDKLYIQMCDGKPLYVVTDRNMYSEGYIQAGRVNGVKRWGLEEVYDIILVEVVRDTR